MDGVMLQKLGRGIRMVAFSGGSQNPLKTSPVVVPTRPESYRLRRFAAPGERKGLLFVICTC